MNVTSSFGKRLHTAMSTRGPICVGIDPHPNLLAQWHLPDTVAGLREFSFTVVDALGDSCAAFKPQSALFERHGSKGLAVLEELGNAIRDTGAVNILDVKRGDIGSTMLAYAQAYLSQNSSFAADAITLSPFLGYESLRPAIDLAKENNKGVFVLALTSNPEGSEVQHARLDSGISVAACICRQAYADNLDSLPLGNVGLVVGATVGESVKSTQTDLENFNGPILAPGFGAQGGGVKELVGVFGSCLTKVMITSSRGVLKSGPDPKELQLSANSLIKAVNTAVNPQSLL